MMNLKKLATHALAFLVGGVVFSFFAFNLAAAHAEYSRRLAENRASIAQQAADAKVDTYKAANDHCQDAVQKIYGTETVLYEAVAPQVAVLHGAVNIQAGSTLQIASQMRPKWLIGMRVTPQLAPGIATGVAYGYIDKKTGETMGPFQVNR
jgi:hypothetical protein